MNTEQAVGRNPQSDTFIAISRESDIQSKSVKPRETTKVRRKGDGPFFVFLRLSNLLKTNLDLLPTVIENHGLEEKDGTSIFYATWNKKENRWEI